MYIKYCQLNSVRWSCLGNLGWTVKFSTAKKNFLKAYLKKKQVAPFCMLIVSELIMCNRKFAASQYWGLFPISGVQCWGRLAKVKKQMSEIQALFINNEKKVRQVSPLNLFASKGKRFAYTTETGTTSWNVDLCWGIYLYRRQKERCGLLFLRKSLSPRLHTNFTQKNGRCLKYLVAKHSKQQQACSVQTIFRQVLAIFFAICFHKQRI